MKELVFYTLITILSYSCNKHSIIGMYVNNKYASHGYALELRQDGTFSWNEAVAEFEPRCKGKWKLISEKMIQLKCDSADIGEVLSSSYLNEQEKTLIVKGKKLQYKNNIVLRKVKS